MTADMTPRPLLSRLSLRGRHLVLFDVVAAVASVLLALALRFDYPSAQFDRYLAAYAWFIPVIVAIRIGGFVIMRLYQRVWRYASVEELLAVVFGVVGSSIVAYGLLFALQLVDLGEAPGFPRSLPVIDTLVMIAAAGTWRFSLRLGRIHRLGARVRSGFSRSVIVGSGSAALAVIRELHANPELRLEPVGVVADDLGAGQRLLGLPVLGSVSDLERILDRASVAVVLLALPNAGGGQLRGLVRIAEAAGARCLTVPSVSEVAAGRVRMDTLHEIDVEDLLRRAAARIDTLGVSASFSGASVLITGAGGSIGGELARQILAFRPAHLILVGRGENSIFDTMRSLHLDPDATNGPRVTPVILDIRDGDRMKKLLIETRPSTVFHAAAHKHVSFMERYPEEAAATNVLGTNKLLRACIEAGVDRFVLISTDKAVNPTSVMGATKRVAELLVIRAARQTGRAYASVRFGNVLSSRGSVVPIFREQLEKGGPLLVTDPDVSRYFMTIPEAVQLVIQAAVIAQPADTLVLDMGEPVKIADLATDLAALHGFEVGRDMDIRYIGLLPGEKMMEELVFPDEHLDRTSHEAILRVKNVAALPLVMDAALTDLQTASAAADREAVIRALRELVPQYQPSELYPSFS